MYETEEQNTGKKMYGWVWQDERSVDSLETGSHYIRSCHAISSFNAD